ncbi:dihydrofolate reductase [Malassezia cuniculi]|uniref:Dihydrofolate reductase n=1 Tax=Malassezia cuniculi TaxID=948313 RepID=A0AAF0ERN4_9BASI|nr:dihydrofolate reductase [Malassezia cuniculi]
MTEPRMDTDPSTGRKVPYKTANQPFLKHQKWKQEQEEKEKRRAEAIARGEPVPKEPFPLLGVAVLLVIVTLLTGQFLTGDVLFGYRSKWTNWRTYIPQQERVFTEAELAKFDGTNPNLPILLAVRGDVFDVTAGKSFYAPGSGYSIFTGKDASRAFVTGCFRTHLTHDLRGLTEEQLKGLDRWHAFYENHADYIRVGKVVHPPIPPDAPIPEPCEDSHGQRP